MRTFIAMLKGILIGIGMACMGIGLLPFLVIRSYTEEEAGRSSLNRGEQQHEGSEGSHTDQNQLSPQEPDPS